MWIFVLKFGIYYRSLWVWSLGLSMAFISCRGLPPISPSSDSFFFSYTLPSFSAQKLIVEIDCLPIPAGFTESLTKPKGKLPCHPNKAENYITVLSLNSANTEGWSLEEHISLLVGVVTGIILFLTQGLFLLFADLIQCSFKSTVEWARRIL